MSTPRSSTIWHSTVCIMLTLMQRRLSSIVKGSISQLQDRLIQNLSLSYNDLASTAIDQEGTMKACEVVEEKKRKRTMSGTTGGSSRSAPPKYRMVYMPPVGHPR
jgi:hypothetical protein